MSNSTFPFSPRLHLLQKSSSPTILSCLLAGIGCLCIMCAYFFFSVHKEEDVHIISPLASSGVKFPSEYPLLTAIMKKKTAEQYPPSEYFPLSLTPAYHIDIPVSAKAYAVMDVDTRTILLAKGLTRERPIASISKVMTALVALKHASVSMDTSISSASASVGEATMGITSGEQYTLEELLYGALLPSGNDAAEAIAESVGKYAKGYDQSAIDGGGARKWFLDEMNKTAYAIGMHDTFFFNPSGLDEESTDNSNFSTPLDLLALGNYAVKNTTLAKIVNTRSKLLPYIEGRHKALYLQNILQLSDTFPGLEGIKPGSSYFAGETLLSYLHTKDQRLIAVILDSEHTKDDVLTLYKAVLNKS